MRFLTRLLSLLAVLLLVAACGGGGGSAGDPPFETDPGGGTGPTPSAADIVVTMSATSVANNGTETAVATATAIDGNRNVVAGVPVTITVDSNAIVTPSGTQTDAEGKVDATIGIGSDHTNRTITITATSGSISRTTTLQVVDSSGGGGTAPSDLLLNLSSATIPNDGSQTVTANVTALDARRNVLPGVAVSVSVDQGATVQPAGTTTGANGVLSAAVGTGGNRTNRTITITATGGGLVRTAQLAVVDSPITSVPEAADLSLTLSAGTLNNGGTSTLTATATAVDSRRNAVAGIPISYTVDGNAIVTPSGTVTNANGVVTAQVGIGADRKKRVVTVTAASGTLTRSVSFSVVGATLTASLSPVVETSSTGNQIEFKLVDTNALAMAGEPISVTAAGLPSASGTTDSNGKYIYTYTAPSAATTLSIVATAGGDTLTQSVTVASGSSVPPATQVPISASLTPTPSVISVNTSGSNTNQVELRALFLGANNQPIKNIRVRFDLAGNANNTDGTATQQGTYAYSDSTGVARGTFTPGIVASPTNGVTVRACYDIGDFATNTCPNSVTNTLTVASEALSVNIRTDNTVDPTGASGLTYIKKFVVMVVDAAGQAKADVLITPSVDLPSYYKGHYVWADPAWVQVMTLASTENYRYDAGLSAWQQLGTTTQPSCPNEDVNRNGVREAPVYPGSSTPGLAGRQEDLNWNGELDPRKADVAIKMVGSPRTDANGVAIVQIEYGKNLASWVDFVITVTASGIAGTEARAKYSGLLYGVGNLPGLADDVIDETAPPPFVISPYGRGTVCTDTN
jgi:hypothetical protein